MFYSVHYTFDINIEDPGSILPEPCHAKTGLDRQMPTHQTNFIASTADTGGKRSNALTFFHLTFDIPENIPVNLDKMRKICNGPDVTLS